MPCIDFREIPEAHVASGNQDSFELFARDFLTEILNFKILSEPSRGADGGKDILAEEIQFGTLSTNRTVGIGDDIGAVHLHDRRFDKEPRLAAAGAADDENIFVSRILWLLRAAGHGEAFCPGQGDVPIGNGVYVGRDIRRRAP